ERELTAWEMLRLRLHLAICRHCRRFKQAMLVIHRTAALIRRMEADAFRLSDEQRSRLAAALNQQADC
ncbi:MAG: zf-HC2 domain-containing protein, partial [Mariprofundaceae bacterium]